MNVRPRIRNPEVVEDARRLIHAGADLELVMLFLRDRGFDKADSIYAIESLYQKGFSEAKGIVHSSRAWSDKYEFDTELMETARSTLRKLAESVSPDLPRIVFDEGESK